MEAPSSTVFVMQPTHYLVLFPSLPKLSLSLSHGESCLFQSLHSGWIALSRFECTLGSSGLCLHALALVLSDLASYFPKTVALQHSVHPCP